MRMDPRSVEQKQRQLFQVTQRLIDASEKRSMHPTHDHPWDENLDLTQFHLKKKECISIYGTKYWDLATEEQRRLLGNEEVITWWSGFIGLEQTVIEFYMRIINNGTFEKLPHIEEYMKHFIKEEIVHTLVFKKTIDYFKGEVYKLPPFIKTFLDENVITGEYPLMSIYITMLLEWIADLYQKMDTDADYVHPLAHAVVKEHWREEMRHIKWGQSMIINLMDSDPEFKKNAQEFTPVYMRQLVDQGITNMECFERLGLTSGAFEDREAVLEAVLYNDHRKALNLQLTVPMMRYFVASGIYSETYHDLWLANDFGTELSIVLNQQQETNYDSPSFA